MNCARRDIYGLIRSENQLFFTHSDKRIAGDDHPVFAAHFVFLKAEPVACSDDDSFYFVVRSFGENFV